MSARLENECLPIFIVSWKYAIKYLPSSHGVCYKSTHRLKFGLPSTSPTCQQEYTVAGTILRRDFISFAFLTVVFLRLNFFQSNTHNWVSGSATTQPIDWHLASLAPPLHANNNTQWWVQFLKWDFISFAFLPLFVVPDTSLFFSIKYTQLSQGICHSSVYRLKFGPAFHLATMPTTIHSSSTILKWDFIFFAVLPIFVPDTQLFFNQVPTIE